MYMLTNIREWINGLSIVIGAWVAVFSVPRIYKDNQVNKTEWGNKVNRTNVEINIVTNVNRGD